jgi:hypothetical protein
MATTGTHATHSQLGLIVLALIPHELLPELRAAAVALRPAGRSLARTWPKQDSRALAACARTYALAGPSVHLRVPPRQARMRTSRFLCAEARISLFSQLSNLPPQLPQSQTRQSAFARRARTL